METGRGALSGRRVLEIADESGVYCGKLLADMGADVIKVERPGGDGTRGIPPFRGDQPHPDTSLFFLYMNASKRGVTLDLEQHEGQVLLRRLARAADILIETFPTGCLDALGLGYGALRADNPSLVFTSITGFGQTGPHAHYRSCDLVANALGGAMYVTGDAEDPPVVLAGSQAHVLASTCAAVSSLFALHHATVSGEGQHVDISLEESMAAVTHICGVGKWLDDGIIPRRWGTGLFASVPSGTYRCKDGLVYLMINRPLHWKALAEWIHEVTGNETPRDPLFDGPSSVRQPHRDLLDVYINDLTSRFTVNEIYHEGQRRHIAFTPVQTAADVVGDGHLAARGYFVDVEDAELGTMRYPGAPYRHAETPWRIHRPAPRIGEHNDEVFQRELGLSAEELRELEEKGVVSRHQRLVDRIPRAARVPQPLMVTSHQRPAFLGELQVSPFAKGGAGGISEADQLSKSPSFPLFQRGKLAGARDGSPDGQTPHPQALAGLRVVEFTAGMAGPWIGRFMAYCGAEVIKVESRQRPDVTRLYVPPYAPELGVQTRLSPWFTDWNAGKRFVALDLTQPRAVELAQRIVALSDVVVENYATGVMEKLGLGYDELRCSQPDLVMLSTTGYGDSGPLRRYVTWGPNIEALSGLGSLSGFPHRSCTITQYAHSDPLSALHGLVSVMCALEHRRKTGQGQYINLSQLEATVSAIGHVVLELLTNGCEPQRMGNSSRYAAPHGCYRCKGEDRWCAIAVFDEAQWAALCRVIGKAEWRDERRFSSPAGRLQNVLALDRGIEEWTAAREPYEVMDRLQEAGVPAGVVQTIEDQLRHDRQLQARGFFEEIDHEKKGKVIANGIPLGLTGTPGRTTDSGAAIGRDNDYVFGELLGMERREIDACVALGAIEVADEEGEGGS